VWDGVSNVLVEICYDNVSVPGGGGDYVTSSETTDALSQWNRATTGSGCGLSAVYNSGSGYVRPDITFTGFKSNNPAETDLNSSSSQVFGLTAGAVHFYSDNKKTIASIKSLTPFDYGCTQVKIDRAGTAATLFTSTSAGTYRMMDKTFQVIPSANNTTGSYQLTLYFTAAEKAGWEAATGESWNNIKLVKVKSQISNYTVATPQPDGNSPVEIVTPVFGTFGNDYTLTYTFNSGFSGFGAGVPLACSAPVITSQPVSQSLCAGGGSANLTVAATGTGLTYQWRKAGVNITGATSSNYSIATAALSDSGSYDVVISNSCGSVASSAATLTINSAPIISTQPQNVGVCNGSPATFSVLSGGNGINYQWRKAGINISGATSATYTIANATTGDAGNYDVVVSNSCGNVTSNSVSLTVNLSTTISTQPHDVVLCSGATASFSVNASGTALTYQWYKNGTPITGATSSSYSIINVNAVDAAGYSVSVTGSCGAVTSSTATLSLTTNGCNTAVKVLDADISVVRLMPNLFHANTVLQVVSKRSMKISWKIVDMHGRNVRIFDQQVVAGTNNLPVQLPGLASGSYYLIGQTAKGWINSLIFVVE
jgi:hypothetical protein